MSLEFELNLRKPVTLLAHEALLNTYYTASCLKKKAGDFLRPFGLTDVQFNLMMLLKYQSGPKHYLTYRPNGKSRPCRPHTSSIRPAVEYSQTYYLGQETARSD
jgi:hypothetical protein